MENPQQNKFNMYQAGKVVLTTHKPIWESLTGFNTAADDLETNINTIALLAQAQSVRSGAAAGKNAALESLLDAFGVTAGKLTTLKKKIDDYETSQPRPRQDRANTRAATRTLPDLFDATDEILNDCLDGLMVQFKDSGTEF